MSKSTSSPPRVVVAMSGGIDSAVAAALLVEKGYRVTGAIMTIADIRDPRTPEEGACFSRASLGAVNSVRKMTSRLGIPLEVVDLSGVFREKVLDYFRSGYRKGRTPNPCVRCNRELKFGALPRRVRERTGDFDFFATGHYARIDRDQKTGRRHLLKGVDPVKDQSYFLYHLKEQELHRSLFPLGGMTKSRVRQLARSRGLHERVEGESQDFYSGGYHRLFTESFPPGDIVNREGEVLGSHPGIVHYTVGQRRGLGIAAPRPLYVLTKNAETRQVTVGYREELMRRELTARGLSWVDGRGVTEGAGISARIRYQHPAVPVQVFSLENGGIRVLFSRPVSAVTPGQVVVFYRGERMLGGGIIQ